ncbi:hemagglutinin repeat-containing protein [Collimonas silvisoli]|uniref:hemagglutinin repeat-containing protein n=1 Tax=Collimonas silvisoli TaxID=2825884 RepID=UPI001B8A9B8E|nr:hemagglutinin repeat-containing protein [Collimonas silvisoli]
MAKLMPNLVLPNSQLFTVQSQPDQPYLIETDPKFTNYKTFISSDYLLGRLSLDPQKVQKRLGDGFYEQKLINDQIAQLTGKRFLDGYASNEAQYKALMEAGVASAAQFQLTPGIALSAAQMAALTSDIVWLVEQEVTLPDGSRTKVLAPVVYLSRASTEDIAPTGALISGKDIDLTINGNLHNGGTLQASNKLIVQANDIANSGDIRSTGKDGSTILVAQNDILNNGGSISGHRVGILAGRDVAMSTAASSVTGVHGTNTTLGRVASVTADQLSVQAGRDLNLAATAINTTGDAALAAGRDLNLTAVNTQSSYNATYDNDNHLYQTQTQVNGSAINARGKLALIAGQDINAAAAYANAGGQLVAAAGRDVHIGTAQQTGSVDQATYFTSKGMLSSSSDRSQTNANTSAAIGSTLSGDSVIVQAGRDIGVTGSNIVATNDVDLHAKNNVTISSAQNTSDSSYRFEEKTSGVFSSGGVGFTAGKKEQQNTQTSQQTTQTGSIIGSTDGNIRISAGNAYTQTGSDVIAPKGDIDILAQKVDINAATETMHATQDSKFKQSGVTVAVTNPVISAVQTGQQMGRAASQTGDGRMQVLAGAVTALSTYNAVDAVSKNQSTAGGVNVSVSLGSSKSQSHSEQSSTNAKGSNVAAGGNLNIVATGGGKDSNINVIGSNISAGNNAKLIADNDINLQAAKSTYEQHSSNSSSSASVGVGFGTSTGFSVNASASKGRGNADGSDVSYSNTHVSAGNQLLVASGGDTNLIGAVASGKQVMADVGGNLNIESLQDTSTYNSKQNNAGVGVSIPIGPGIGSVSGNISKSKIDSNYQSVTEQSGIKAGDGGFDITVKGNTDLKGAVIASTDKAVQDAKNSLTTGTLTQSDIQNKAEYKGESMAVGGGYSFGGGDSGVGKDQKGDAQSGPAQVPGTTLPSEGGVSMNVPIAMSASGSASSTTASGVSGATVKITDDAKQQELTGKDAASTIAGINTDVASDKDGSNTIKPIFNLQEIQAGFEITKALGNEVGTFINNKMQEADAKKKAANDPNSNLTPDQRKQLLSDAQAIEKDWGANGTYRQIATALTAAASGNVTGGGAQFVQAGVVNYVQQQGAGYIGKLVADGALKEGSPEHAALHAIVACAGAAASSQSCGAGAMGAATSSLLTNLFADNNPNETNAQKEAKGNLVNSLVAGLATMTGANGATATNAATVAVDNNWLSPKLQITKAIAKRDCDNGNQKACGYVDDLNKFDVSTKKQLDQLVDACSKGAADACAQAKQVLSTRMELAKEEIQSCSDGAYSCHGMYLPSAREVAEALEKLPGAGSGATTPTMDPVTAVVLLRMGLSAPYVGAGTTSVAVASEGANQYLYGDGTFNYERMMNAGLISWGSAGIGSALNSLGSVAALGGATNAAITAYNNSQTGSNDSIAWSALTGAVFSAGGKIVGDTGGHYLNGAMNYTQKLDPKVAALLQRPGGAFVPTANQSNLPWIFRNMGNTWLPGTSAVVPSIPANASGEKK